MANSFEGKQCEYLGLARLDSFKGEEEKFVSSMGQKLTPIVLVKDDCKPEYIEQKKLKFPEGTLFVSCFWFYFSVHFKKELILEPFIKHGVVVTTEENGEK